MTKTKSAPNKQEMAILESPPTTLEKAQFLPALVSWLAKSKEKDIGAIPIATIFHGTVIEL